MAESRKETVARIWEKYQGDHQGRHLAVWAKDPKNRRERQKRWAAIADFALHRRLSKLDAKAYRDAHRFKLLRQWTKAKARRLRRLVQRAARRRRRRQKPSNTQAWGGSQAVGEGVVTENASDYGVYISSRKRSASDPLSISNPSSDHNEANGNAYAWDLATFNGTSLAHSIAKDLGISGYSTGNYNSYTIHRSWGSYRAQILWAVSGHFNHVHVGIRRA